MKRTILITGSNGHLGQQVVSKLSDEGHQLIAAMGSCPFPESFKDITALHMQVDLNNEQSTEEFVEKIISQYPKLDAAVLLAGGFEAGNIEGTNEALLDRQIALNFKTAWLVVKPIMAHFKKIGTGQFILICARPAVSPEAGKKSVAYAISKSMLLTLAEIINADGSKSGITASVIIPSILDTQPNREDMPDSDFEKWVKPSRIAETISFILSDVGKELRQPVFKIYNRS